jgi:hypothetical protein
MPISSYPRITLEDTAPENNPLSGTGLCLLDNLTNTYRVANSDLFPINEGGLAANNTLISSLGPKLPDLLVDVDDTTIANRTKNVEENLRASDYLGETIGNTAYESKLLLENILIELQTLNTTIGTGVLTVRIKSGSSSNIADVNGDKQLLVKTP